MDVGDLPNHVKYCVPVCLASNGQLSEYHRSVPNPEHQLGWIQLQGSKTDMAKLTIVLHVKCSIETFRGSLEMFGNKERQRGQII